MRARKGSKKKFKHLQAYQKPISELLDILFDASRIYWLSLLVVAALLPHAPICIVRAAIYITLATSTLPRLHNNLCIQTQTVVLSEQQRPMSHGVSGWMVKRSYVSNTFNCRMMSASEEEICELLAQTFETQQRWLPSSSQADISYFEREQM